MSNIQQNVNQLLSVSTTIGGMFKQQKRSIEAQENAPKQMLKAEIEGVKHKQKLTQETLERLNMLNEAGELGDLSGTSAGDEELDLARRAVALDEELAGLDPEYAQSLEEEIVRTGTTPNRAYLNTITEQRKNYEIGLKRAQEEGLKRLEELENQKKFQSLIMEGHVDAPRVREVIRW